MRRIWRRVLPLGLGAAALWPAGPGGPGGFDLKRFAELPVLHAGRVKPLDTVARSSLLMIKGGQTLSLDGQRASATRWLLEAAARPESADAQKIFRVDDPELLGLMGKPQGGPRYHSFIALEGSFGEISAQAERAESRPASGRSRFQAAVMNLSERLKLYQSLKNTLRPEDAGDWPAEIARYRLAAPAAAAAIGAHMRGKAFKRSDLAGLGEFFERCRRLTQAGAFRPLPPSAGSPDWSDSGSAFIRELTGDAPHPGADAYAVMLEAYRAGDAAAFNRVLGRYRAWLEAEHYRESRAARYEAWFNRAEPFYRGMILYLAVFLLVLASFIFRPEALRLTSEDLLWLAFAVHSAGLAFRILLQGRPPVTNLYSSAVFVGWGAAAMGLCLERMYRNGLGALVASAMGFSTLIIAHHLAGQGDTIEMMRAVLDSNFWLATHVVTITIGYSAMFLASALAHVFLFRRWMRKGSEDEAQAQLASMVYGTVCAGLFFSFLGTVLGGIWADQSWGRFWGWDPKENGALLIVLWSAILLHARWGGYIRRTGVSVMAVFGGVVTSLSWFGVNMLGVGLHSYGFMESAVFWLAGFAGLELGVMALAWRRAA
ncbi:MAG: cytochrome c biogenesis protein CcsA [Elusimicrobia bacterium]|nr:cytochrome c biogenesis protein CcsA [Elusimicrobiota bacterium]